MRDADRRGVNRTYRRRIFGAGIQPAAVPKAAARPELAERQHPLGANMIATQEFRAGTKSS